MKIEASQSIINDIDFITDIEQLIIKEYFGANPTKKILQMLYDDIKKFLDPNVYSELEVGFCQARGKLWVDFNSNSSGETHPIFLEF